MGKGKKKQNKNVSQPTAETVSTSQTKNPVAVPSSTAQVPPAASQISPPANLPPAPIILPNVPVTSSATSTIAPDSSITVMTALPAAKRPRKAKNKQQVYPQTAETPVIKDQFPKLGSQKKQQQPQQQRYAEIDQTLEILTISQPPGSPQITPQHQRSAAISQTHEIQVQFQPPGSPQMIPQQQMYAAASQRHEAQISFQPSGSPQMIQQQQIYAAAAGQTSQIAFQPPGSPQMIQQQQMYAAAGQRHEAQISFQPPGSPQMIQQQQIYAAAAGQTSQIAFQPPGSPQMIQQQQMYAAAGQRPQIPFPPGSPQTIQQQQGYPVIIGQIHGPQFQPPGSPQMIPPQQGYAAFSQRLETPVPSQPGSPKIIPQQQQKHTAASPKMETQAPSQPGSPKIIPQQQKHTATGQKIETPVSSRPQSHDRRESPSSMKSSLLIPKRPKQNESLKKGKRIEIATNHFALTINLKQSKAIHYDVEIEPDKPKKLFMNIFSIYFEKYFPKFNVAFDGMKNMYSPVALPLNGKDHIGTIEYTEEGRTKPTQYTIKIQFAAEVDLTKLMQYFSSGTSQEPPQNALQCLDVVLRHSSVRKLLKVGRCFFAPPPEPINLGGGLDLWYGHFQSVILGWKPFFNLDVAHKGFTKHQGVKELIDELDESREKPSQTGYVNNETLQSLRKYIRNLKVQFMIPNQAASKRLISVKDIAEPPKSLKFKKDDGSTISVYDYFLTEKKYKIQYVNFPCLATGKDKKICYPAELCTVVGGQNVLFKMDPNQTRNIIRAAATKPPERQRKIKGIHQNLNLNEDPTVRAFGLSVGKDFERVPARILDAPLLQYADQKVPPRNGVWNPSKFFATTKMDLWTILIMDRLNQNSIDRFVNELLSAGKRLGIQMAKPNLKFIQLRDLMNALKKAADDKMQIIFVIISGRGNEYAQVKQFAELKIGALTQCIKRNTVDRINASTATMILQKVNAKLDSTNHTLEVKSIPNCLKRPCMIVGADVTHPAPTQDNTPSFVAVTASHDIHAFKYNTSLKIQPPAVEIITDLQEIMRKHLVYFRQKTNFSPKHIIMFRDGVSESQFQQVLQSELTAIRAACKSLQQNYEPHISIFIVQKRHHTRFFPTDNNCDRNSNPLPGTCVDSQITHPTELDFYLLSHASIQGTARPTRYHCIWDDANMPEDEVEHLAYYLCHLFTRCTRTVSYPAPTYYAHLAAARAKVLCEGENIDVNNVDKYQSKLKVCEKIVNDNPMFFV